MLLPIPLWIAAGVLGLAGFATSRTIGNNKKRASGGVGRGAAPQVQRLTLREFFARHLAPLAAAPTPGRTEPRTRARAKRHRWIQLANACFFPACALAFAVSFLYPQQLLRVLSVSGMIGLGTNWLAITMLFHPRKKHLLLGQGLIPKQREELVEAIADGVSRNLINEEIIRDQLDKSGLVKRITSDFKDRLHELLGQADFRADLGSLVETYIRDLCQMPEHRERIIRLARELLERLELEGIVGRLVTLTRPVWQELALEEIDKWVKRELPDVLNKNLDLLDKQLEKLPAVLEEERPSIEQWLSGTMIYLVKRLDIKQTMLDRLRAFDNERVESLVREASNDQLDYITLLGGILGVIAGFVLWHPIAILWIAGGGLLVAAMDPVLTWLASMRRQPMAT